MKKRIRYVFKDPMFESRETFRINGHDLKILIDKDHNAFYIINQKGDTLAEGGSDNYNVLLKKAKRALERIGYKFDTEERDRDYGLVKKETPSNG